MKTLKHFLTLLFLGILLFANAQSTEPVLIKLPKPTLSVGYGSTMPSSATKDAYVLKSSGISGDVFIPFSLFRKGWDGWSKTSIGLNIGGTYNFSSTENPSSAVPQPFNVFGQTSSKVSYKEGASGQTGFRIGGGPQVNFNLGEKFTISPMVLAEYFSMKRNPISAVQTTTIGGVTKEYTLWTQPERNTNGLAITPKVRMQYFFSKNLGIFADAGYIFGKNTNTALTSLVPLGKPNQAGQYDSQQLEFGTQQTGEVKKTPYNAFTVNVGLSLAFGGDKGWNGKSENIPNAINSPNCSCGNWAPLISYDLYPTTLANGGQTTHTVACGGTISAILGNSISFSNSSYVCGGNGCTSSIYINAYLNGVLIASNVDLATFAANQINTCGLYRLELNPTCSSATGENIKCPPCSINIDVACSNNTNCCQGSSWGNIQWLGQPNLKCGATLVNAIPCGSTQTLNYTFNCSSATCPPKIRYDVINSSGIVVSSTNGISGANTNITMPTTAGNYCIIAYGMCGNIECSKCSICFKVICEPPNCCLNSSWGKKLWKNIGPVNCNTSLTTIFPINTVQTVNYTYNCNPAASCLATIKYEIVDSSGNVISTVTANSGVNQNIILPSSAGKYCLIAYAYCNGVLCNTCTVCFTVTCENCKQVFISSPTPTISGDICSLNGSISGATALNPLNKILVQLVSFSANKATPFATAPVPNFEFTSASTIKTPSPVSFPFSLTGLRSNIAISTFSTATTTIPFSLKIDKMTLKTVKSYRIKFILFFADGTNCEKEIIKNF